MNPPQSPDLSITEGVWDHFDGERNKRQPTSKEELWDVPKGWRTIPEDYLKKTTKSLSNIIQLCNISSSIFPIVNQQWLAS